MRLIIDGYNLLHVDRSLIQLDPIQLQWERDRLIDQLSDYGKVKQWEITVVFDGWQGGWHTEKKERKKGVEIIFSRVGEKADEVIKRLARERGSGALVVTSDRDISKYAERMAVAVIPSDQFKEKMENASLKTRVCFEKEEEEEGGGLKRKGPSRRLSKKDKRKLAALKKL
jgi:predicted RNA-binding protein with PIN domain